MIDHIRGRVASVTQDQVVLDVAGVGFSLLIPRICSSHITPGQDTTLYTYLLVRQDQLTLYGFDNPYRREMFVSLITVNGIGPKCALNILSELDVKELLCAVLEEDVEKLTQIPGVGQKTARRLVVDMGAKARKLAERLDWENISVNIHPAAKEAVSTLISLGCDSDEARRLVNEISATLSDADSDQIVMEVINRIERSNSRGKSN